MIDKITESLLDDFNNKCPVLKLTNDKFLKVFINNDIDWLKLFIIKTLNLKIDPNDSKIELLNISFPPSTLKEYLKTADFNILLNDKYIINLEFNNMNFLNVASRNYIYLCKLVTSLLKSGNRIDKFKKYKVYQININGANCKRKGYRQVKNLYIDDHTEYIVNNVKIIEINLVYYKNLLYTEDIKLTPIEYFYASLKSKNIIELNNLLKKSVNNEIREKIIKEVMIIMKDFQMVFTEDEVRAMDAMMMAGYEEELANVRKEARKKAILEGKLEGQKEGSALKAIEIAKNMLEEKISLDVIKKTTGLSLKTIKSLIV